MPLFRRSLVVCCLVAVTAAASQGGAAPALATVRLQYEAPDPGGRCPNASKMENAVAARLGFFPFQDDGKFTVRATIRAEARELVGLVELIDTDGKRVGRRELRSSTSDCEGLAEAMAVAVSVALEPIAKPAPPPPPATSSTPSLPPPPPQPPETPPARAAIVNSHPAPAYSAPAGTRTPLQMQASLGSMLTTGTTPGPAFGVSAQFGFQRAAWSAAVEGRAELITVTHVGDREIHTSLISAWLVPCWQGSPWMACALIGAGSLRAEGKGVDSPQRDQAFYSAIGARLGAQLPLSKGLLVRLHGDLAMALTRTTFYLDDRPRWSSSPVHAGAGIALGGFF